MGAATTFRLDLVDTALDCGWEVESTRRTDCFVRDRVMVSVQYSEGDEIESMVRSCPGQEAELFGSATRDKPELLRMWLTGRIQITLGQILAQRRAEGNALLSDPAQRAGGNLLAVTLSGSGRMHKRRITGDPFWASVDHTGVWGLCYAVEGANPGSSQDLGTLWGVQNSYAKAADEVAEKSVTLHNGNSDLKPGSVFCCPAYVVVNDERQIGSIVELLERAYRAWVAGIDPVLR